CCTEGRPAGFLLQPADKAPSPLSYKWERGESGIPSPLQCADETHPLSPQDHAAHRSPRLRPPPLGHAADAVSARLLAEAFVAGTQRLPGFRAADPAGGPGRAGLRGRCAVAADPA